MYICPQCNQLVPDPINRKCPRGHLLSDRHLLGPTREQSFGASFFNALIACVGVLGSAATANAAGGGLSVTPASLETSAKVGTVGSLTLDNSTKETLRVTVTVRPWMQKLDGSVLSQSGSSGVPARFHAAACRTHRSLFWPAP